MKDKLPVSSKEFKERIKERIKNSSNGVLYGQVNLGIINLISDGIMDLFSETFEQLNESNINTIIKDNVNNPITALNTNDISDTYHTFGELYDHRYELYLALCRSTRYQVYKTKKNFEKEEWEGWFILCIDSPDGQISYHLPNKYWDDIACDEVEYNCKYDDHNSEQVLERLKQL